MSRREDIDNGIWSDPDFEALSLEATALYLWSFTNPRCGMAGLYKVSHRAMTESKVPLERLDDVLAELTAARFLFYVDGVMLVRSRVRHLRTKTPQIAKSIMSDLDKVPQDHHLRLLWLDENAGSPWFVRMISEGHVTLDRGSRDGHGNPDGQRDSVTLTRGSAEGQVTLQGNGNGKGSKEGGPGETDEPPQDFPAELRPELPKVVAVLERVAAIKGANAISTLAVARAMASYPRRPHVKAAEGMEHWLVYGTAKTRRVKDVVGTFRNQLESNWQDQAKPGAQATKTSLDIARELRGGDAA